MNVATGHGNNSVDGAEMPGLGHVSRRTQTERCSLAPAIAATPVCSKFSVRRTHANVSVGVPGVEQAPVGDGGAEAVTTRDVDKFNVPHREDAQECLPRQEELVAVSTA